MYKLEKEEGLYRVSDNRYIVANYVSVLPDKVICRLETTFRGKTITTDKEYKLGEVGIFWREDTEDLCSRPLDCLFAIYEFHWSLYDHGFLKYEFEDFADVNEEKVYGNEALAV